jgi:UDP-N-acetylglucosamine diphosphorylase/glucosamine-1-phosphate N-acetyltransferase
MRPVIIFDDGRGLLSPLTDLRASFDVRTGALTLLERVRPSLTPAASALFVPEALAALTRERHGSGPDALAVNTMPTASGPVLVINGRCVLPDAAGSLALDQALVEEGTGDLVAARVGLREVARVLGGGPSALAGLHVMKPPGRMLLSRPWHVRAFRDAAIRHDLAMLTLHAPSPPALPGVTVIGEGPLAIDPSARVYPGAMLDLERGPIAIGEHAGVRPGAIVCGPAWIGPHTTVLDHALVKPSTAIGPWCKVAGEVGGTIFQGFANKAHDGHLGDSWIGEWVNLGAGTTNSNLLNTYGEVVARPLGPDGQPGPNERTGEQFLGAVVGDHVKTAIGTRIMTGAIVGTGTMWAASAPLAGTVPAFSWVTDAGRRPFRFDKFVDVARASMARRSVVPSDEYLRRLRDLCTQP